MVDQRAVILTLAGVLLLMFGALGGALGLGASVVPPDWEVENTKTIYFAYSTDLERMYDSTGRPTSDFDFPIDQEKLPIPMPLGDHTFQIEQTSQSGNSAMVQLSETGQTYELELIRTTRRTYPAGLPDGKRLYITAAEVPERAGEFQRANGEPFLGFKSVTISLAREKQLAGLEYAIMGLGGALVIFGLVIRGKTGKGSAVSAVFFLSILFFAGPYAYTVSSYNTSEGASSSSNIWIRELPGGSENLVGMTPQVLNLSSGAYELRADNTDTFGGYFYEWSDSVTDNPRTFFVGTLSTGSGESPPSSFVSAGGGGTSWNYTGVPAGSAIYDNDGDYGYANKTRRDYWGGFDFSIIPDNSTIDGITATVWEAYGQPGKSCAWEVFLSWDNRASWTSLKSTGILPMSVPPGTSHTLGGGLDTWGHAWTVDEIKNSFWVDIRAWDGGPVGGKTYMDFFSVEVFYSTTGGTGGSFTAQYQAAPVPPTPPIPSPPPTGPTPPAPVSPTDGGVVDNNEFVLDWREIGNAWYYEIWIDKQPTFPDPVVILSLPHEARVYLSNGTYFWKSGTYSSIGPWSRVYTFTVNQVGGLGVPLDEIPPLMTVESQRDPIIYTESSAAAEGLLDPYRPIFLLLGSIFTALGVIWLLRSRGK